MGKTAKVGLIVIIAIVILIAIYYFLFKPKTDNTKIIPTITPPIGQTLYQKCANYTFLSYDDRQKCDFAGYGPKHGQVQFASGGIHNVE